MYVYAQRCIYVILRLRAVSYKSLDTSVQWNRRQTIGMLYKTPLCLFWEEENGTGFRTTEDQTRIQDYELPGHVLRDGGCS